MIPEWEQQSAIVLTWPHIHSDWKSAIDKIEKLYLQLVALISDTQDVYLICYDTQHKAQLGKILAKNGLLSNQISLFVIPTNDTWIRDYGPISVLKNKHVHWINFSFNAWGKPYPWQLDNKVTSTLSAQLNLCLTQYTDTELVFEGGNLESNGSGLVLCNKGCATTSGQNTTLAVSETVGILKKLLSLQQILWIEEVLLEGDDTGGHIDNLVRFCSKDTIIYNTCSDPQHTNYPALQRLKRQLQSFHSTRHGITRLIEVPSPPDLVDQNGNLLPASYINFLITNKLVIMPTFDAKEDNIALEILKSCFPTRRVIGLNCCDLIQQRGGIHCASLQLYAM